MLRLAETAIKARKIWFWGDVMNYLQELNAFRDWTLLNHPSTGQIALWYSLMSIDNMTGWQEWFTVANQTLQLMTGMSKAGLDKARGELINKGLVQYKSGSTKQAGKYRLVSIYNKKVGQWENNGRTISRPMGEQWENNGKTINKLNINETKQKDTIPFREIISALNEAAGTSYKSSTKKNQELIQARWNEGFRLPDFLTVIRKKVAQWKGTENEQYLRPLTLFGTKFESYLNQPEPKKNGQAPGEEEKDFGFQYDKV